VPASALTALAAAAAPGIASAAPHHNHGLTISASPNPIVTGDPVLIYGQLNEPNPGAQKIMLYHRVNPKGQFSLIGQAVTNQFGFYEFTRATDVVTSNRSWYVRAPGITGNVHSRTVHERVAASVDLAVADTSGNPVTSVQTNKQVTFTGNVLPAGTHTGESVFLQQQVGAQGDTWHTLKSGRIGADGSFSIAYRFKAAGDDNLRVVFRGDDRNVRAESNAVTVTVTQKQNPLFTVNSSATIIDEGQTATLSGILYEPTASPLAPAPGVNVTLWGRTAQGQPAPLDHTITGTDGSYSFTVAPQHNSEYYVRTTFAPFRATARLFVGVSDVLTLTPSSTTAAVGQKISLSGTVNPDKAGHLIELQRLGKDNQFHTVAVQRINISSGYSFNWKFGNDGPHTFRTVVPGGPENVNGQSAPVTIAVSLPSVQNLPGT
jgi:hypothetical protein